MLVIQSKKTDYNTKIREVQNKITTDRDHDKCVATQEFDKLTSENFTTKLKQAHLGSKNDFTDFIKKTDFYTGLKNLYQMKIY